MRTFRGLVGVLGVLVAVGAARAQETLQEMSISGPEVEARSGPSDKFYATSKLHQGDKVVVIKGREDNPGWLAIKPPPGSFSWINGRFVKMDGKRYARVVSDDEHPEEVRVGSEVENRRPDKVQVHLKRGTQIILLDRQPVTDEEGNWYPIQAPPEEVRYIPASAVGPVNAKSPPQPAGAGKMKMPPFTLSPQEEKLYVQAEQFRQAGKFAEAKQKYQEAADQTKDHNHRIYFQNRIDHLNQAATATNSTPKGTPTVTLTANISAAEKTSTQYITPAPNSARWVGPGWLQRSTIQVDGRAVYALVDQQGKLLLHVVPQVGGSLEQYVGRSLVQLYGPVQFRGEGVVRSELMTVTWLNPLR
jgi:hypothetical protein